MRIVTASVMINNPADRDPSFTRQILVTTAATDSLVPRKHLEALSLAPEAQRTYILADGREVREDVAVARIGLPGTIMGGTVLFRGPDAEPLPGATALVSLGIEVYPLNQRLKKLPAVPLKGLRTQHSGPAGIVPSSPPSFYSTTPRILPRSSVHTFSENAR